MTEFNSRWKYIIIHHSASTDSTKNDTAGIRHYHTKVRGWRDVGYNFLVEKVGDSYEALVGRPLNITGAHCPGRNSDGIGVCVVGDFSEVEPTEEQYAVVIKLVKGLAGVFNIPAENIRPHKDFKATACPGLVDIERLRS